MDFLQTPQSVIQAELLPGEKLFWSGVPRQGLLLQASDIFMIPFSLLWGGFAIFWMVSAAFGGAPFFFVLFGVPFVLVGLYFIFGRFIHDSVLRGRTFYGLTDRRVIIVTNLLTRKSQSINLQTMPEVTLSERSDGSGTITFGAIPWNSFFMNSGRWPGQPPQASCFVGIAEARSVYNEIRRLQSGVPQPPISAF